MQDVKRGGVRGRVRCGRWLAILPLALGMVAVADAQTLNPSLLPRIKAATFEVVAAKPTHDPLTYARPLPLDLLSYQRRTDKYYSIGTAFAIGPNRYVTAGHVLMTSRNSLWGPLSLRDDKGHVYRIDQIEKFALRRDFAVFSLVAPPHRSVALPVDVHPAVDQTVYAVGNAFGSGVTIRAGSYTSNTPEQQDGAWKWIRFSAAASPGDSGGPLLNQNGQVIGVVLASSANENLNYALPISEVLDAPAHVARFDHRGAYGFALIDSTLNVTFKTHFLLPKSLKQFDTAFLGRDHAWEDRELKALLAQQAATMFPQGQGSDALLHSVASLLTTPWLYERSSQGMWQSQLRRAPRTALADNGYLASGVAAHTILFHLHAPDSLPMAKLRGSPETLMNLILKQGLLRRTVGSARIKVTSLGKPALDHPYTDRWQRHWRVMMWPIPYDNRELIVLALPVPDGYVGMLRGARAFDQHVDLITLEAMTDFFNVAYGGTLAQWRAFLRREAADLPPALQHVHLDVDYGKHFVYASPRVSFSFTSAVQKIAPDSRLTLGCNFSRDAGKAVWGVGDIRIVAHLGDKDWINVERHEQPSADLDDAFQAKWRKITGRQPPWNGVARNDRDITKITGVMAPPDRQSKLRYTVFYARAGQQAGAAMKSALDLLMRNLKVHEPGYRVAAARRGHAG